MNELQELLDGSAGPLEIAVIRDATAAALHALRHDRRLVVMVDVEARARADELIECADIRTLARHTSSVPVGVVEHDVEMASLYPCRLLFEVVDEASLADPGVRKIQRTEAARGGQMRVAEVPFRLHIYDRREALVAADFDDNGAGAIAVTEPRLVQSLTSLHARLWQSGRKWTEGNRSSVDLADVLAELLTAGTDEACAHRLQIGLRTYRRKVKELMALLGARSRFEAGSIAEQRKYLDLVRREAPTRNPQPTP